MRERELKLSLPDRFELPELEIDGRPVSVEVLPELRLRATYHDTEDLRLARHGITLRHRSGELDGAHWTLKLPTSARDDRVAEREEVQVEGPAGQVPDRLREMVTAYARTAALRPVATLRTRRRRWQLSDDGVPMAEVADDQVSVLEGRRVVSRFRELEIEAMSPQADLGALASQLATAGATVAEPIPKVVRALGSRATAAPDVAVPDLGTGASGADLVGAVIADATVRMLRHDPLAREGDEEAIHQLRVATRRLRSDLRALEPLLTAEWRVAVDGRLQELADRLGAVRDLDVLTDRLSADSQDLRGDLRPLWRALANRRARALRILAEALRQPAYAELLERLVESVERPPVTADAAAPAPPLALQLSADAWRRLQRRAKELDQDAPDDLFHATRLRAKRVRYTVEAAAGVLPAKRAAAARRFASRVGDLQDLLGGLQDSAVAVAELRAAVEKRADNAPFALAAGRLIERQGRRLQEARAAFGGAWADLRKRNRRRWMEV